MKTSESKKITSFILLVLTVMMALVLVLVLSLVLVINMLLPESQLLIIYFYQMLLSKSQA